MTKEVSRFKNYLSNIVPMDDATFGLAENFLRIEEFRKSDFFVREGNVCHQIAFIDRGLFRIFFQKQGNEINTCFCKENSITSSFGSFVNRTASRDSIQALEDSTLLTLSHENLMTLYERSPLWHSLGRLLTEKECLRLSNRASSMSFETALEKYQNLLLTQPDLLHRVAIQHIASYLGVSRETLSRIRSKIA